MSTDDMSDEDVRLYSVTCFAAEHPRKAAERILKLQAALDYVRSLAHMEQASPTELHMTCLSIIEKTADEALRFVK